MRALYSTIGTRVVAADAYVVEVIALREIFHHFEEGWTVVSNNLAERSTPTEDVLIDPVSKRSGGLCSQHVELGVVGEGTMGLDNILICSGWRHMHGVDVGFCEDRSGSGDDWWDDVRGHLSISLLPISSPTLHLFICIPPPHLCTIFKDHT
jgi:hypothetical protein